MKKSSIGIIVAHPDDEVLMAGGAIARHFANGDDVHLLILSSGVGSRSDGLSLGDEIDARLSMVKTAEVALGGSYASSTIGSLEDNRFTEGSLLEAVKWIEDWKSEKRFSRIITHSTSDLNSDHVFTARATLTAFRPLPSEADLEILGGEVLSSSHWGFASFNPRVFIDISEVLDRKIDACEAYDYEFRDFPHARSYEAVKNLAGFRGSVVGRKAAEAFECIRSLE